MEEQQTDSFLAGRLIQWGLQTNAIPFNEPEYMSLIDRFVDRQAFRSVVRDVANGLGLTVVRVTDRGLFLGSQDESVFALKSGDFRSGVSGEDRLLDGLVEIAIAATVYPRQRDLDEDSFEAKPPITVAEVDQMLRELATAAKSRSSESDVSGDHVAQGIQEAWRVYESRPAIKKTKNGNFTKDSTHGLIQKHLQLLASHGCFTQTGAKEKLAWRPTLRYQILVKDLAATELYRQFHDLADDNFGVDVTEESSHA
jgi:hypothetical protein